jgi:hypothetical protein
VLEVHGLQWDMRDNILIIDDSLTIRDDAHEVIEKLLVSNSGRSKIHEGNSGRTNDFADFQCGESSYSTT